MAKAAHLSLSSFLIGFLLVLVVADVACVRVQGCDSGGSVQVDDCNQDCDSICRSGMDFLVSHTECHYTVSYALIAYCTCCK
ncbi:hypothetical protein MKW94_030128 [Papaver nudicaule]|uniref:Uncharacterized protein n=1 Tax=Papaver nudicaule TaxID=74823 RepID=A0AA41VKN0_PAPNU|nr:hypothetical protein [Papaver nudicaule]